MNEYIYGTTEDHGDIGMVRDIDFGYYTQMVHGRGFTHGYRNQQFYKRQYFKKHGFTYDGAHWIALDGLNTLFHRQVKLKQLQGYTHVYFEIRPFIPEKFDFTGGDVEYSYVLREQLSAEHEFTTYKGSEL